MSAVPVLPSYQRSNVLVGEAAMYYQPYNASVPPVLPAITTLLGGSWPSPWTAVGATISGLDFKFQRNTQKIMVEEQSTPVQVTTKDTQFTFDAELSEDTFNNMLLAYGGGVLATTAATSTNPAIQTFTVSQELTQFAFAFEASNELGFYRRVMIPIVVSVANASTKYRRADSQRTYAVSFESLVDVSQCTFVEMRAPHS